MTLIIKDRDYIKFNELLKKRIDDLVKENKYLLVTGKRKEYINNCFELKGINYVQVLIKKYKN